MATVSVPESLARLFPGMPRRFEAAGSTVAEVLLEVDGSHRGFRERVCATQTRLRRHVLVFVDGEVAGVETAVGPASDVLIVPALSGG